MSIFSLFRRDHVTKFFSVLRRDGMREALRRALYYGRLILFRRGRSAFGDGMLPGHPFATFWKTMAAEDAFFISRPPTRTLRTRRIALIGDINLPQCRKYRVEQLQELWAAKGVELRFSHFEDVPRATDILQTATHAIFYRLAQSPLVSAYLYEARRLGLPILYDIDDPLFSAPAYATYGNAESFGESMRDHFIALAPLYAAVMNACDMVSVSTPALQDHARQFCFRPIHLRRNFADRSSLEHGQRALEDAARTARPGRPFTLAFASGSRGHEADIASILPDLSRFLAAAPDRRLLVLGRFDTDTLPREVVAKTEVHPFLDYDAYLGHLATADCAVLPLTDDIFNRCKSGVRVIDAASVAVPSLVPDFSDSPALIVPGETGLVVDAGGWRAALETLAADRDATKAMGRKARTHLEGIWSSRLSLPVIDPAIVDWLDQ